MTQHKNVIPRRYEKILPDILTMQLINYNDERRLLPLDDAQIGMMFKEHDDFIEIVMTISTHKRNAKGCLA